MPKFSYKSLQRLSTADERLQKLFHEVIKEKDCTVICGHRGQEEQDKAFKEGNSKLKWPKSSHNSLPSKAVDVIPYPIDWKDLKRFKELGEFVIDKAEAMGINISWGGHWKSFKDFPHYELVD